MIEGGELSGAELRAIGASYKIAITPFLKQRSSDGNYSERAMRQFQPNLMELDHAEGFVSDPTGESRLMVAPSVVQVHANRAAFTITLNCQAYCRFCFRKARVGRPDERVSRKTLDDGYRYLEANSDVVDVLISGGDPLAAPMRTLLEAIERISSIPHVRSIRLHTRVLTVDPHRVDVAFADFLDRYGKKVWFYAHVNHPDDLSHSETRAAIERIQSARVPILTQSVLLKGVNDNSIELLDLFRTSYALRLIPYHLYVLDRVAGAHHFEVANEIIAALYQSLNDLPGPAKPALVYVDRADKKHSTISSQWDELLQFLRERDT